MLGRAMEVYGIADRHTGEVDEWHTSRQEAEATVARVLEDEPEGADELHIAAVELLVSAN
jgi:hypothetical protein